MTDGALGVWPSTEPANADRVWKDRGSPFLNREDLIHNKKATGRPEDLVDLEMLERVRK